MAEEPTTIGKIPVNAWWTLVAQFAGVILAGLTLFYLLGTGGREDRRYTREWQQIMQSDMAVIKNTQKSQSDLLARMEKEFGRRFDIIYNRLQQLERETFPPRQYPPP